MCAVTLAVVGEISRIFALDGVFATLDDQIAMRSDASVDDAYFYALPDGKVRIAVKEPEPSR